MAENFFTDLKITDNQWDQVKVAGNAVRPNSKSAYGTGLTPEDTKKIFDKGPELIKNQFNKLVGYAFEEEGKRIAAEKARAAAEGSIESESGRAWAEKLRGKAETAREDAEEARAAAEGSIESKSGRAWAEKLRDEAETERKENETRREALAGDLDAALDELHAYAQALIGGGGV